MATNCDNRSWRRLKLLSDGPRFHIEAEICFDCLGGRSKQGDSCEESSTGLPGTF